MRWVLYCFVLLHQSVNGRRMMGSAQVVGWARQPARGFRPWRRAVRPPNLLGAPYATCSRPPIPCCRWPAGAPGGTLHHQPAAVGVAQEAVPAVHPASRRRAAAPAGHGRNGTAATRVRRVPAVRGRVRAADDLRARAAIRQRPNVRVRRPVRAAAVPLTRCLASRMQGPQAAPTNVSLCVRRRFRPGCSHGGVW